MSKTCPKCNSNKVIKNGFARGHQRYKCKDCSYQFTRSQLVRGKPLWMKLEAVLLYMSGMSMNAIGEQLAVSAQSILNWVRDFAKSNYEKPTPGKVVIIELDEMWHFLQSKKTNYGFGKPMTVIMGG